MDVKYSWKIIENKPVVTFKFKVFNIFTEYKKAETTYFACLLFSPHNRACHFYWVHGCDKVTSLPSSSSSCIPSAGYLHVMGGGGYWVGSKEGVQCGRGRLCLCVRGRGVSGGGEGGCLFEDSARSLRLVSPAWLFEAVRWPHRATSPQVGGWGEIGWCWCCCWWWGGMEACHLYTAVSFILSSSPPPPPARLSLPLLYPLVFLCCCCFAPFLRPLQAL